MALISLPILGIDISKAKFDVALLIDSKIKKTRVFENNLWYGLIFLNTF